MPAIQQVRASLLKVWSQSRAAAGYEARARACYSTMCQEVITGQYLEFTAGQRADLSEGDLLQILRMKSGRYSVERPIQIGALLAGASDTVLQELSELGLLLGEAFQLHDDVLGMFGDSGTVGKPVGGDLVEGKYTLLMHYTLEAAGTADAQRLRAALGNAELGREEIDACTALIVATGARDKVAEMIETRHRQAAAILDSIDLQPLGKSFLGGLIRYLQERNL